jgi:hypothetical protein
MQGILPTDVAAMQDRRMRVPTGGRARMQRMRGLYEHRCCAIRLSHTRGCARVFPRRRRRSSGGSGVFRLAALNCCKELLAREASGASEPTVWIGCIRSKYVCVWASTVDGRDRELWRARNRSRAISYRHGDSNTHLSSLPLLDAKPRGAKATLEAENGSLCLPSTATAKRTAMDSGELQPFLLSSVVTKLPATLGLGFCSQRF